MGLVLGKEGEKVGGVAFPLIHDCSEKNTRVQREELMLRLPNEGR